jgi:hypothetical protein
MTVDRKRRLARLAILLGGLAWSLFVSLPASGGVETFVIWVSVTMAPYLGLAAAARWLPIGVLLGVALGVFTANVATLVAARSSASSTAAVAMLLAPILIAAVVVPLAVVGSWVAARINAGRSGRESAIR